MSTFDLAVATVLLIIAVLVDAETPCSATTAPSTTTPVVSSLSITPFTPSTITGASTRSTSTTSTRTTAALPKTTTTTIRSGVSATPARDQVVSVSRAGGRLNPSAAAEANAVDTTAVKAFASISIRASSGDCLTIDPTAGDFRENLIPIALGACDGGPGQKFDIVTSGEHNNVAGSVLIVSSLTQGCLNFDPRREPGDRVIMFSCGGRADGSGAVTDSQLFTFREGVTALPLAPRNARGATCFEQKGVRLEEAPCSNRPEQLFTLE